MDADTITLTDLRDMEELLHTAAHRMHVVRLQAQAGNISPHQAADEAAGIIKDAMAAIAISTR